MFEVLSSVLNQPLMPVNGLKLKTKQLYRIDMVNSYLNNMGRVFKRQKLYSTFTRTIEMNYPDTIAFLSHNWEKLTFTAMVPKSPPTSIDWTFAQGRTFYSIIVFSYEKLREMYKMREIYIETEDYRNCFKSIEESYAELPKLPATYLVIMQTLDIIAFDNYVSYIHTYAATHNGWKPDEWVIITPPELEHTLSAKIGFGLYSEESYFKNSKFHMKFTGYGNVEGKACALFDFYCDNSQVRMQEKNHSHIQRNGTSYYHGQVWIDLVAYDFVRGTMLESYIALQEGNKVSPVHIRRKILCEAVTKTDV
jgi:hypothetical protein